MLNQDTKQKIKNARDILVGKVPDPKAQVEQITFALIYKFMDDMDKQSQELPGGKAQFFTNGYEKYAWSKILDSKLGGHERLELYAEAITRMSENKHIPQLFRDVFKDAFLPYRSPETLSLFLKEINGFSYDHSEDLGDSFEYLLSILGSQGDAGQFRTPRHIIDFIVEVVAPKKDESVLDPACGTAGFLISAYKHILKEHKSKPLNPDEKSKLMKNLVGYDISPDMVRLSKVNMYLHGFAEPKIYEYDTLSSEEKWDEMYDVIMANPPFMTPKGGIMPHKRFSVQANRAEVLFVDYIKEHLRPNGRAGVIVPEGIIFQSGTAYKQLRKILIEDGLFAVVSLPAGVFNPYSNVKTSILFFDNSLAKKTDKILFVRVLNDGFDLGAQRKPIDRNDLVRPDNELDAIKVLRGQRIAIETGAKNPWLQENSIFAYEITKEQISRTGDYNLSAETYRLDNIVKLGKEKWPFFSLGDVVEILDSKRRPITKSNRKSGQYPYYGATGILDYVDGYLFDERLILVGEDGAKWLSGDKTAFIAEGKYWVNNHAHVLRPIKDKIIDTYLVEILNYMDLTQYITGVTVPKLNQEKLRSIKIPLPPIKDQQMIVDEIEGKQVIIEDAKELISKVERERAGSGQIFERTECDWVEVKNLFDMEYGYTDTAKNKGDARFVRITDITSDGQLSDSDLKFINLVEDASKYLLKTGDLLVARTGATYGKTLCFEDNRPSVFASFLIRLRRKSDNIEPKYYWCFAQTNAYWNQAKSLMTGGAQPQFNANAIGKIKIPVPNKDIQKQIIEIFTQKQIAVEANNNLISMFDGQIREKIAEAWGV